MEVQDTRDSRREMQMLQEAVVQQNQVLQRLERSLRRLEESYEKVSSRLDAVESSCAPGGEETTSAAPPVERGAERGRVAASGGFMRAAIQNRETARGAHQHRQNGPAVEPTPGGNAPAGNGNGAPGNEAKPSDIGKETAPASRPNLISRAKVVLRGAIADGSVNSTLDKVQSSIKLADEAAGALAQISAMVKASLAESAGVREAGSLPIPGGSLTLLLELAKTPQFQRFVAGMLTQFLKDADPDTAMPID